MVYLCCCSWDSWALKNYVDWLDSDDTRIEVVNFFAPMDVWLSSMFSKFLLISLSYVNVRIQVRNFNNLEALEVGNPMMQCIS